MTDVLLPFRSNHQIHPLTRRIGTICGAILGVAGMVAIAPQSSLAQVCGTPGKDGVATPSGVVNTYYPGTGTASAGSTTVGIGAMQLGGVTAIGAGDLVLILQMQDGSATTFSNDTSYGGGMGSSVGGATGAPGDTRTGGAAGFDISVGGSTISNYGSAAGLSGLTSSGLPHSGCTKTNVLLGKRITALVNLF